MAEEFGNLGEPDRIGLALLGVAAAVAHQPPYIPGLGEDRPGYDLPGLNESLNAIAATPLLSGAVKTQLLAQVFAETGRRTPVLDGLAASLVKPDIRSLEDRAVIVDQIFESAGDASRQRGGDLFHRRPTDLIDKPPLMQKLLDDVADFLVEFEPLECRADDVVIGGTVALDISTTGYTSRPLPSLANMVDPLEWPKCDVQHLFFRSMNPIGVLANLVAPDQSQGPPPPDNWKGEVEEVVDWSFGAGAGWATFTTDLDFVVFRRPERIGCTYDLVHSEDLQVEVDQGYLLAEDLRTDPGMPDLRRVRTLKQVHFTVGDVDPEIVCLYWGPVVQLIAWACAGASP